MNIRISLLWRTVILLTLFVVLSQIMVYFWIKRSVNEHFEVMDAEMLTHAVFNLRKSSKDLDNSLLDVNQVHRHDDGLDYNIKVFQFNGDGHLLIDTYANYSKTNSAEFEDINRVDINELRNKYGDKQFQLQLGDRSYRSIIISLNNNIYMLALPIDVHHIYLNQFTFQLKIILFMITLLLVSIAAMSVYWGFSPLTTFIQRMKSINSQQLGERITVSDMPGELRPLAESYNIMMNEMEDSFQSLSRFSDNIAHELRTPIAILTTQTQVMLSQPRETEEYIEQLHHQHETLQQLSGMINNMLLLAKTQKGLSKEQLKTVDLNALLEHLIVYYEFLAEDKSIVILKTGEYYPVEGAKGLLQRLFSNLLSNAIYYSKSHSTILISAQQIDNVYRDVDNNNNKNSLSNIQQTGSCLPMLEIKVENKMSSPLTQKEVNRLFERFYRYPIKSESPSETVKHSGSGLGLSIVKAIVQAHGGSVKALVQDDELKIVVSLPVAG